MTPKEKAIELVSKFYNKDFANTYGFNLAECEAKQCALICVDEILKSHYKLLGGVNTAIYKHYQQVKQEIQKL
jgi:hypothetical protein